MALFGRRRPADPAPVPPAAVPLPAWAYAPGLTVGPVPPDVVALVLSGALPPAVAACVLDDGPDWLDVADAVDEVLGARRAGPADGALCAMGAYAQLESCFTMVDETRERAERAQELLQLASAAGIDAGLGPLYHWADSLYESGAEAEEESAELAELDPDTLHGDQLSYRAQDLADSGDPEQARLGAALHARLAQERADDAEQVLDARCRQGLALYAAGDRDDALALLRPLVEGQRGPAGLGSMLRVVRSLLVVDAAQHGGPAAARETWRRMRGADPSWPPPGVQEHLAGELLDAGVPDVLEELAGLLRPRAVEERSARLALARLDAARTG